MIRVLMVCYGNICRSPMAEAVFRHKVALAGLADRISVDSASTSGLHNGETAHPGTLRVLEKHNIAYDGRSRRLTRTDLQTFDYVLGMDADNMRAIASMGEHASAYTGLFLEDAYRQGLVTTNQVDDPYYTGFYDDTYALVETGCEALLERIRREHGL
jgi:protein-tyrosine phosphatase